MAKKTAKREAKKKASRKKKAAKAAEVLFAPLAFELAEAGQTLPVRFERLLDQLDFGPAMKGKRVAVKMHLGGGVGYTTVHPLFVRILVRKIKEAGGKPFVTDLIRDVATAVARGYTEEVLDAPLVAAAGLTETFFYSEPVSLDSLKEIQIAGEIHDADVLVNLSHVKGHGACGFGGACKNVAMGCVSDTTRMAIHALEGGMTWDPEKCTHCEACIRACNYGANRFNDKGEYRVFYHNCVYCMHCVAACPEDAITVRTGSRRFRRGWRSRRRSFWIPSRPTRCSTSTCCSVSPTCATAGASRRRRSCPTWASSARATWWRSRKPPSTCSTRRTSCRTHCRKAASLARRATCSSASTTRTRSCSFAPSSAAASVRSGIAWWK